MRWFSLSMMVLLGLAAALGVGCVGAEITEVGVRLHFLNEPLLTEGRIRWGARLGVYAKVHIAPQWTLRPMLDNPLEVWLPSFALASTHTLTEGLAVEAVLSARAGFEEWLEIALDLGGRAALGTTAATRWMVSSFPVTLAAIRYQGEWNVSPILTPNATFEVTWAATDRLLLGQAVGVSVLSLPVRDNPLAVALNESIGLVFHSITHAGMRF